MQQPRTMGKATPAKAIDLMAAVVASCDLTTRARAVLAGLDEDERTTLVLEPEPGDNDVVWLPAWDFANKLSNRLHAAACRLRRKGLVGLDVHAMWRTDLGREVARLLAEGGA